MSKQPTPNYYHPTNVPSPSNSTTNTYERQSWSGYVRPGQVMQDSSSSSGRWGGEVNRFQGGGTVSRRGSFPVLDQSTNEEVVMEALAREVLLTDYGTRLKLQGNLQEGWCSGWESIRGDVNWFFWCKALQKYQEAARINPNYAPAYYNIGVVYVGCSRISSGGFWLI